jgi:hypothetical protein
MTLAAVVQFMEGDGSPATSSTQSPNIRCSMLAGDVDTRAMQKKLGALVIAVPGADDDLAAIETR